MDIPCKSMGAAALLAVVAGCGGPPDDVTNAARQARVDQASAAAAAPQRTASMQRGGSTAGDARPTPRASPRDIPSGGVTRAPAAATAVMGAGPAPTDTAAAAQQSASAARANEDALITSRVRGVLDADREVGPLRLDVDTREGIVTLSGTVPTVAIRARAGDLAKSVRDVKSLNDQLTLATG